MAIRPSDLWRWDGEIDRGPYALFGVVGFALRNNLVPASHVARRILAVVVGCDHSPHPSPCPQTDQTPGRGERPVRRQPLIAAPDGER